MWQTMIDKIKRIFKKKKTPRPAPTPERVKGVSERRPVQEYVYPPVAAGIPRFSVEEILEEHKELIKHLQNLSEHDDVFDLRYRPAINRYAAYVYLLPAREAHHHRGAGGLLSHGLETAKYVLQQTYERVHGIDLSPLKRKLARERWLFACFLAAMVHDIGKPTGMRVYSVSGVLWEPFSRPLAQWFQELPPDHDRLFVTWLRDGQDHRRMGLSVITHVITPADMQYLNEVEPFLTDHIYQAILGEKDQGHGQQRNHIPEMLQEADRRSLTQDLQKSNLLSDLGPEVGQPLARLYVLAMKRLVQEGQWRANEPGSVLWVIGTGVYLVFPEMAADVTELLHQDGIPGIPSNEYILAEVLEEHGLLVRAPNGSRLWRIWPSVVNAGEEGLLALKLKDARYVIDVMPPAVPGEARGEGEEEPLPAENVILFNQKSKSKGREVDSDNTPPRSFNDPFPEGALKADEPSFPLPPSPGLPEEHESPQGPQALEELQEYFAGAGLGGRALIKFATEVARYVRREGLDYKNEPRLLLVWGERKFTQEENLPEVIESLARAEWLVLNGDKRVHDEPGFGRCMKLVELETTLFWRLVWKLRDAEPLESRADASLKESPPESGTHSFFKETNPQEAAAEDLSKPRPSTGGDAEKEPAWVAEVAAMLHREGALDYDLIKEIVAKSTGRGHGLFQLVSRFFEIDDQDGKLTVFRRKP